VKNSLN
jgi:hypothetical protein